MTNSEKKKIEKALKFVAQNNAAIRKRSSLHRWGQVITTLNPAFYDKTAKKLGPTMFDPLVEYFYTATDGEKDTVIVLLHRLHRFFALENVPLFFLDVILDDSAKMEIRKTTVRMLWYCFSSVSLDKIKQIYKIEEFRFEALGCLPFCENEERHQFAIEVLREKPSSQITEKAIYSLIAEKIKSDDALLLKELYFQSKDPHLRYYIMELFQKSPVIDLHDYFVAAYKKERLLPNRLQAIIGLYVKSDIELAEKTMKDFVNGIIKQKDMSERTLGDLRGMITWLEELKKTYPYKGFYFAYETLSSMEILRQ